MMTSHEDRARIARAAFEALGPTPNEKMVLMVQCSSSHHLATVHATPKGRVYHAILRSTSHGRKDREDVGHHASRLGSDWYDLLEPDADPVLEDNLPAGCECGPYTLSRELLVSQIADGEKKVIIK